MFNLLGNGSISEIVLDNDSSQTTGKIYFMNGEVYIGEVY